MREESGTAAYRNPLALPMVYAADAGALEPLPEWKENPFWNQNLLLNAAAGRQEDYFTELEYVYEELDTGWLYRLRAESADPLYLYMKPLKRGRADVYVNDIWRGNYFTTETTCCLYLGSYLPGQEITVRVERTWEEEAANALIVELDMNLLRRALRELQDGGMEITDHGGGKIRGVFRLRRRGLFSLPFPMTTVGRYGWMAKGRNRKCLPELSWLWRSRRGNMRYFFLYFPEVPEGDSGFSHNGSGGVVLFPQADSFAPLYAYSSGKLIFPCSQITPLKRRPTLGSPYKSMALIQMSKLSSLQQSVRIYTSSSVMGFFTQRMPVISPRTEY